MDNNETRLSRRQLLRTLPALALTTLSPPAVTAGGTDTYDLSASGHPLREVLAAVSRASGIRLTAAAAIAEERVGVELQGRSLPQIMAGLARLLRYAWKESRGADGQPVYRLEPPRKTRELEAYLRRLDFVDGLPELRRGALHSLRVLNGHPFTRQEGEEYHFGDHARATHFLSALTEAQVELLLRREYVTLSPHQLSPLQRELLAEYVRICLVRNLDLTPEERERSVASLSRDGLGTRLVHFRTRPARHGVVLEMRVPDSGRATVELRSKRLEWPPGICPYEYAAEPSREWKPPPRTGDPVDVEVPKEWSEMVPLVQALLGKPVFTDWLTSDPYTATLRARAAGRCQYPDRKTFLDALCSRWLMLWWDDDDGLYVRDRAWYLTSPQEPPASVRRAFEADVRAGRLRRTTVDALAQLTRPQLLTLVEQTEAEDEFQVSEEGLVDWLSVYSAGSLVHREATLGAGLAARHFAPAHWRALQALPPDAELREQAGEHAAGLELRLVQRKVVPEWDEEGARAYLRVDWQTGSGGGVGKLFRSPLQERTPALVCERSAR